MFKYNWLLSDGYPQKGVENHNKKVFSTFLCGGGSSMGYKLAGFNHLGGVEIDPEMANLYKVNHNPKYLYNEDIRIFLERNDLPNELFDLDILDGSPPCTTFSTAGKREDTWGVNKVFKEGQSKQVLDDLVFVYVDLINKLQPKVALLENVSGIIKGNAKAYSKEIVRKLSSFGYETQVFLLNASTMGVPQKRQRVFFIAKRKDLKLPKLTLNFNEKEIPYGEIEEEFGHKKIQGEKTLFYWKKVKPGDNFATVHPTGSWFNVVKLHKKKVVGTITTKIDNIFTHHSKPYLISNNEIIKAGTFPLDYNFLNVKPVYPVGMSVPPVMTAQIAYQIYLQLLK